MSSLYLSNHHNVPFNDRALHYGEGLFETFRFNKIGEIPLWQLHQTRLKQGLERLGFAASSQAEAEAFLFANIAQAPAYQAGKLLLSRSGLERGYAGKTASCVNLLLHLFNPPALKKQTAVTLQVSPVRLASQPLLAGIKHSSRMEQILALSALSKTADDALLLDHQGLPIESGTSNLLLYIKPHWITPKLDHVGVRGTTRQWLMQQMPIQERAVSMSELYQAQHLYLCNAIKGIYAVQTLLGEHTKNYLPCAKMQQLQTEFGRLFE